MADSCAQCPLLWGGGSSSGNLAKPAQAAAACIPARSRGGGGGARAAGAAALPGKEAQARGRAGRTPAFAAGLRRSPARPAWCCGPRARSRVKREAWTCHLPQALLMLGRDREPWVWTLGRVGSSLLQHLYDEGACTLGLLG